MAFSRYHPQQRGHNLTVLAFPNSTQAFELRDALLKLQSEALFELSEAVVLTRDSQGKVTLDRSTTVEDLAGGATVGSLVGVIVGTIFMMPGLGIAVGTGVGAAVGALADLGIKEEFIKDLAATVKPGTSALAVLGSKAQLDQLGERLGSLFSGAKLLSTDVNPEREAEIREFLKRQ